MEKKLLRSKNRQNFASFCINRLFYSNFGREPQKSRAFTLFSCTERLSAANSAALAPHTSSSTIFCSLDPALTNKLIYLIYTSATGPIPRA